MDWTPEFEPMRSFNQRAMFILPPANTSYLAINATLGPTGTFIQVSSEPYLPGLLEESQGAWFHTYNPDYFVSNARVYELPLDPKLQYNISLASVPVTNWDENPDPILCSVTFYSSLW